jgi:hypothetical protein
MDVFLLGNLLTCFWGDEAELHVSLADSQERWLDDRGTIEAFRTQWRPFLDASHRLLTRFPALLRKQPSPPPGQSDSGDSQAAQSIHQPSAIETAKRSGRRSKTWKEIAARFTNVERDSCDD